MEAWWRDPGGHDCPHCCRGAPPPVITLALLSHRTATDKHCRPGQTLTKRRQKPSAGENIDYLDLYLSWMLIDLFFFPEIFYFLPYEIKFPFWHISSPHTDTSQLAALLAGTMLGQYQRSSSSATARRRDCQQINIFL